MSKSPLELLAGVLNEAGADEEARATAQALLAAHVGHDGKVADEKRFVDSVAAALIAARTAAGMTQNER